MQSENIKDIPLVSICCITYNHEPYLKECLKGFLIQKTDFFFEILIHDDASTDGTRKIIEEYTAKYPDLFIPIYQKENQYSKGVRSMSAHFNFPRARGMYIALCEGDDYWTDPYKLQKQVDFLVNNNDYGLVYTNYLRFNSNKYQSINCKTFSGDIFDKLIMSNFIGTLTVCFSKDLLDKVFGLKIQDENFKMGDYSMWLAFSSLTKFKFFSDATSVYRISPNTLSNQLNERERFNFEDSVYDIRYFFLKKFEVKKNIYRKVENSYLYFLIINNIRYNSIINNRHFELSNNINIKYLLFFTIILLTGRKSWRIITKIPF